MTRIEIIEKLLKEWKANYATAPRVGKDYYHGGVTALESALHINRGPSNTQLKLDGLPKCLGQHNCPKAKDGSCDGLKS